MYALWMFGSVLERITEAKKKKFLIFYLVCSRCWQVLHKCFCKWWRCYRCIWCNYGLAHAAFAYTFPNTQFYILPFPFPIKAKYMAAIYAAIDLFGGFFGKH